MNITSIHLIITYLKNITFKLLGNYVFFIYYIHIIKKNTKFLCSRVGILKKLVSLVSILSSKIKITLIFYNALLFSLFLWKD